MASSATSLNFSPASRQDGPDTLSAAMTWQFASRTGAATASRPTSSSSLTLAHPRSRTSAGSASSWAAARMVAGL